MAFEYLAAYATFKSVDDMDVAVEQHIQQHYYSLTESERAIVFALASRSLAYPGASHLKAETIAEATGTSRSTVMRAIKKLTELNIIEKVKQTKMNGIKGASIYKLLPYDDTSTLIQRETAQEVNNDNDCEPSTENQSFSSFSLLKTSSLQEIYNNTHAEKEARKEWMNEWQQILYDFMYSLPLADQLKDELHKMVLASQIDNAPAFHQAKDVIVNIARDIANGTLTVTGTLRAIFVGAYGKAIERIKRPAATSITVEDEQHKERPVPFYDWLSERESTYEINDYTPIENWLEW
ncbi:helix-turn-helix domain-containing protein [Lysinibacillus odysseyi]|uniref:helix-turn-helix domain-containing protein n=1 Tax=Lysinibacillus odysseyi TaxID=202611 RepID=UPI0005614066|nr:helix-turn-helix domain-containing protein [Lysinibacillus odysseyi]